MADSATEQRAFPAPGSAVPGAPPPLRRPLTPADGELVGPPPEPAGVPADRPPRGATAARDVNGTRFTTAAALLGVAIGLELAGLLSTRSRWSRPRRTRSRSHRLV
ncbi:hypothetical protein [Mycolicibacterium goodii]|uniref:hypothetical protein n=1 Tax=Mycolicibacterium goodii TaxID=134601 RepID=UPI001BDC7AB6|nr:hypothetical protein [Mycolicibacterium goodii]MBU8829531.1 hypothetical protein [Mycolicibacterium goodii]